MTQYAYFDSTVSAPSPVIGWYDTDEFKYLNLPAASDLLEVTAAEWAARLDNPSGWAVSGGALVAYTPPVPPPTLAQQASTIIKNGVTLSSKTNPSLDGVYSYSANSVSYIQSEMISILTSQTFTDGSTSLEYFDKSKNPHYFSIAEFQEFAKMYGKWANSLIKIIESDTGTLPDNSNILI